MVESVGDIILVKLQLHFIFLQEITGAQDTYICSHNILPFISSFKLEKVK